MIKFNRSVMDIEKKCIEPRRDVCTVLSVRQMSAKKMAKKAKTVVSTLEPLSPVSLAAFKDFTLSRAYDIISEGDLLPIPHWQHMLIETCRAV